MLLIHPELTGEESFASLIRCNRAMSSSRRSSCPTLALGRCPSSLFNFGAFTSLMSATDIISASLVQKSAMYLSRIDNTQSWFAIVMSLVDAAQVNNGLKKSLGYARETNSKKLVIE